MLTNKGFGSKLMASISFLHEKNLIMSINLIINFNKIILNFVRNNSCVSQSFTLDKSDKIIHHIR